MGFFGPYPVSPSEHYINFAAPPGYTEYIYPHPLGKHRPEPYAYGDSNSNASSYANAAGVTAPGYNHAYAAWSSQA